MNSDLKSRARKILEVDLDRLEEEWEKQPLLCFEFMTELVEAREEMDRRKADLELTDAELDHEVRSRPEEFGLDKVTEPAIKATILCHDRHRAAHHDWLAAKSLVGYLQAAVECVTDQRKKALENEVDLLLGGYWSKPRSAPASPGKNDHARKKATRPVIRPNTDRMQGRGSDES